MFKRFLIVVGCVLALPLLFVVGMLLYSGGETTMDALQHRLLPPTRITITWPPSEWGCDEYHEAYQVVKIEYPNSLVRRLFQGTTLLVPYPSGRYGDTTAFHRYYR